MVARDACWFVYGNDHLLPEFSRTLLEAFAQRQQPSGKIVEFYRGVAGTDDDYGLNINDDTPLFILAVNHHYRATGDLEWLRRIYPAVARTARYIISQRDERGLVFCTARDPARQRLGDRMLAERDPQLHAERGGDRDKRRVRGGAASSRPHGREPGQPAGRQRRRSSTPRTRCAGPWTPT